MNPYYRDSFQPMQPGMQPMQPVMQPMQPGMQPLQPGMQLGMQQQIGLTGNNKISRSALYLNNLMRTLWAQHGEWTRMTLNSLIQNLPDLNPTLNRLLRNPKDFAKALRPLYGDSAASAFERLLTEHLTIAADLVKAAMAGDSAKAAKEEKLWYENADKIAELLGRINPYWSVSEWKRMLHEHLRLVKQEAVNIMQKKYAEGISTYDEIEVQAMGMADYMTSGIMKQFPQMFM